MKQKYSGRIFIFFILPVIFFSILAVSYLRLADNYELETLDMRFRLRPQPATTDKIILIEIGDDTVKNLGQWPISRSYHAILVKALSEAGAKSIVFDLFFSEPGEYDDDFEGAIKDAGNVYLPFVLDIEENKKEHCVAAKGYVARNLERLSLAAKGEGHINILPDIDGKFRRVPPLVGWEGKWYPHIAFLVACDYLGMPLKNAVLVPGKYLSLNDIKVPLDDYSNLIVNFSAPWGKAYKHYSYSDVIQSYLAPIVGKAPILDLGIFKDKVCVIGLTAAGTVDLHPNPFETLYPGFGIHAEIFNSVLNKHFIRRVSRETNLIMLAFLTALIIIATLKTKPFKGLIILVFVSLLFIVGSILLFNALGLWIDLFYPVLVIIVLYLALNLYKYVIEWKKRLILENELGIAKKIQESLLPKNPPSIEGLEINAVMFTARQVGGDLYDFAEFSGSKAGIMIGDVSGKGVPASLFMAKVTGEFKFFAKPDAKAHAVLDNLNSKLVKESSSNLFVTMFYIIFDMKERTAEFSNGGHLPVVHLSSELKVNLLDVSEGMPLGLLDSSYASKSIKFDKGDIFVLYTDGITEAMDKKGRMYGQERLVSVIKGHKDLPSDKLLKAIEKDVRNFEPRSTQHDDITLIVARVV